VIYYFHYALRAFLKSQRRAAADHVRSTRRTFKLRQRNPRVVDKSKWNSDLHYIGFALDSARLHARAVQMLSMHRRGTHRDAPFRHVERFRYRPTRLSDFEARMACPHLARDAYSHYHARYLEQEKAIRLAKALITNNPALAANRNAEGLNGYFDHPDLPDGIRETVRRFGERACGCVEHDIRPLSRPKLRRVTVRRKKTSA
jgi:hypothetical protein